MLPVFFRNHVTKMAALSAFLGPRTGCGRIFRTIYVSENVVAKHTIDTDTVTRLPEILSRSKKKNHFISEHFPEKSEDIVLTVFNVIVTWVIQGRCEE